MATLNVMNVVFFLIRMAPAIIFVLFMMILFFSFRVDVKDKSMERFVFELSDSISSDSSFVSSTAVFSPEKLFHMENERKDIEQFAQNCDFGYTLNIKSAAGRTSCSSGSDCVSFCKSACNLDDSEVEMSAIGAISGNCGCGIVSGGCQCKKQDGNWQDDYEWSFGYSPNPIYQTTANFPAGIDAYGTTLPATMTITAYESFLTKISCASYKAYHMKETSVIKAAVGQIKATSFKRSGTDGTHVCLYKGDDPIECRYLPGIPLNEVDMLESIMTTANWKITVYPLKSSATCSTLNPSLIAGKNDAVNSVLLCMEAGL